MESNVRSYSRSFPVVFRKAVGALLEDEKGSVYIDLSLGGGVLNYGYNDADLLNGAVHCLKSNGIADRANRWGSNLISCHMLPCRRDMEEAFKEVSNCDRRRARRLTA